MWLGAILWFHRKRYNRRGVTGVQAAASILADRKAEDESGGG